MKLRALVGIASTSMLGLAGMSAQAVTLNNNLRDGLELSIGSSISPAITSSRGTFRYHYGDSRAFDVYVNDSTTPVKVGTVEEVLAHQNKKQTDERARLDGAGSAVVWFVANQRLDSNTTLEGEIDLQGTQQGMYPNSYGLSLNHAKLGSLGIKTDASMVTGGANLSRNYSNFDYIGSAVTASYTAIPDVTLATYYAFNATDDVRYVDASLHKGYGVYGRYYKPFAPKHNLTLAAAATHGTRHVDLSSDSLAKQKTAFGAGLQYQYQDVTLAVDTSHAKEQLNGALVDKINSHSYGVNLGYQVTPRLNTYVYYGNNISQKTPAQGNRLDFEGLMAQVAQSANGISGITQEVLFDKVTQGRYGVGASYNLYRGVSVSASAGKETQINYLTEGKFSQTDNTQYRVGMNFRY